MKNIFYVILIALFVIVGLSIIFAFEGLLFWGVGSLFCWAFNINFEFTYFMGVVTAIFAAILVKIIK